MPETYLEENRFLYIESKLGKNELLLESFTGSEGISQLFSFQLELLSENKQIKFEDILGKEISFGVVGSDPAEPPRCFHGIVTAFTQLPDTPRLARYQASVAPRLWILTRKQNCRIFQKLSVPDILKKLLEGIDVTWELRGSYAPREYCVQYRETDFNFLSRLMEEEGIFYFFRFTKDSHKLVIADSKASHHDLPGGEPLIYDEVHGGTREETRVYRWVKRQELGPGKFSLQDYFFENPQTNLFTSQEILQSAKVGKVSHALKVAGNDQLEIYDYPGGYDSKGQGQECTKHAVEQLEMSQFLIHGESNIYHLTPGYRFTLTRHPHADGSYVLTSVSHSAFEGGFHSAEQIGQKHYANQFSCIPLSLQYRPPRTAQKPRIWGCQTAVVVGPAGEEIYTDKYGRVKVHFHWDRYNPRDQSRSCWIRVASHWAGQGWGAVHIPRIGQEVVVDFLEGDPDRPIIVGSVYNGMNLPPYDLPDNKTQSGIKSRSSMRGSQQNYNEIRFEDKKGSELITIHAERNLSTTVENDETHTVHGNRTTTITKDDKLTITDGDRREIIEKGDDSLEIRQGDRRVILQQGNDTLTVQMGNITIEAPAGKHSTTALNVEINGTSSVKLMCGSSSLQMTPASIDINSPLINIKGGLVKINC